MTKVLKNKSWSITILTLLMGLLLPIINAQLPEDRQVSDDFADNLIYVALGIGAIGAGASATKRLRPNMPNVPNIPANTAPAAPATISTYDPEWRKPETPTSRLERANPKAMSKEELEQMVADLQKQAKG